MNFSSVRFILGLGSWYHTTKNHGSESRKLLEPDKIVRLNELESTLRNTTAMDIDFSNQESLDKLASIQQEYVTVNYLYQN